MREELTNLRRFYGDHVPTLLEARHEYAVLCPLVERPDGLHLLFEVRSAGVSQSGETCFPGGQMEPGEAPADCALRETDAEASSRRAARGEERRVSPAAVAPWDTGFSARRRLPFRSP